MFFSIHTKFHDQRFTNHHRIHEYFVSLDSGWEQLQVENTTVFYKGYCDEYPMRTVVDQLLVDPTPRHNGNFGVIIISPGQLTLTHDLCRSFPLNLDNNDYLTNITKKDSVQSFWSDTFVVYENQLITTQQFNAYNNLNLEFTPTFVHEFVTNAVSLLGDKTEYLNNSTLDLNLYVSCGLDTTLLYAIARSKLTKDYNLLNYEHIDYDMFLVKNYPQLRKEYAVYNQFHVWKDPTIVFNGAPGDEYFMRGPYVAAHWAAWHDIDLLEILQSNDSDHYHKMHFLKPANVDSIQKVWNSREQLRDHYPKYKDLCKHILDICANDHQMWHCNNTITWTPFKDLRLLAGILCVPPEAMLGQILNGDITRLIINQFDPHVSSIIDQYKNYQSYGRINSDTQLAKLFG